MSPLANGHTAVTIATQRRPCHAGSGRSRTHARVLTSRGDLQKYSLLSEITRHCVGVAPIGDTNTNQQIPT